MSITWKGVMPATVTQFNADLSIDHALMAEHGKWLVENGCSAIVAHGSLGEGATLDFAEKIALQKTYVEALPHTPIIPGVAALSTREAVDIAKAAKDNGCRGLMVLPPYLYASDWREMKAHMKAVISATDLPCILYNNPVAYKTDFTPLQIKELADELPNLESVKESSTDARRIAGIRETCGDRLTLGVGVDDCALEGAAMGAKFWITGVGGAFPRHNIRLWDLATTGRVEEAMPLYHWMLPMLRMDTVVKFVQLIKLQQTLASGGKLGNNRVRPPRLELIGSELAEATAIIEKALATAPEL
ncbi:MAG: dihydrodipicolinate synthase family protein [Verrucomicrobia bacterium]|nr:MAG: dihydrodipicolinate synthase family protein [Verrucomicrobiota bacterium]TAE86591.1 MAG: dihydrodipicolinate synthase family protein [Verrucomicrobiota bacterium]TAF24284.1 MAG: dihydrodipicolinate synthase family protein [Verrucomicrobiota bacterium]TAF40338.1 MAG: dihydrodipicolinate synthase family protein [Verrucomicrobiota bacterium]